MSASSGDNASLQAESLHAASLQAASAPSRLGSSVLSSERSSPDAAEALQSSLAALSGPGANARRAGEPGAREGEHALTRALGQVDAWMRSEARSEGSARQARRAQAEPAASAAQWAAERPLGAPRAAHAEHGSAAQGRPVVYEAAPRLTIGSIEVRVVPPVPPPVAPVRASVARGPSSGASSSAPLPSHLTFGLRQR